MSSFVKQHILSQVSCISTTHSSRLCRRGSMKKSQKSAFSALSGTQRWLAHVSWWEYCFIPLNWMCFFFSFFFFFCELFFIVMFLIIGILGAMSLSIGPTQVNLFLFILYNLIYLKFTFFIFNLLKPYFRIFYVQLMKLKSKEIFS